MKHTNDVREQSLVDVQQHKHIFLLGRDTADGLKQSAKAKQYMDGQVWESIYPIPDLFAARTGPEQIAEERLRLDTALQTLANARREVHELREKLEEQRTKLDNLEKIDAIQEKEIIKKDLPERKTVGFEEQETWGQWFGRVFLRRKK